MEKRITESFCPETIYEYDSYINDLRSQLECYKSEHDLLKKEINSLVEENHTLSQHVSELIGIRIESEGFENDQITNLKNQLELLSSEKKCSYELWQDSLKIIEHLEEELQRFRGTTQNYVNKNDIEKLKKSHSKEVTDLQDKIQTLLKSMESQKKYYTELEAEQKTYLKTAIKEHKESANRIKNLEQEISNLRDILKTTQETMDLMQKELKEQCEATEKFKRKDDASQCKVAEAVSLTEAALFEKDAAIMREVQVREELAQLTNTCQDIIKEAGEKVNAEVDNVKKEYNSKLKELCRDMKDVKDELNERNVQLDNEIKKRKSLEEEIAKYQFGSCEDQKNLKILNLEKNLESTFQKLILSERRIVQITSERESLKLDLDMMSQNYSRASDDFEARKKNFLFEIKKLRNQVANNNILIEKYEQSIKSLVHKTEQVEQDLKTKINNQNKSMSESITEQIKKLQTEYSTQVIELKKHLKSERMLNKKWKSEVKDIMNKLQNRIRELKDENSELRTHLQKTVNPEAQQT